MENRDVQILECATVRETHFSGQGVVTRDWLGSFQAIDGPSCPHDEPVGEVISARGNPGFV